jgi:hypothetical protein
VSDLKLRNLERAAANGDADAQAKLERVRKRVGTPRASALLTLYKVCDNVNPIGWDVLEVLSWNVDGSGEAIVRADGDLTTYYMSTRSDLWEAVKGDNNAHRAYAEDPRADCSGGPEPGCMYPTGRHGACRCRMGECKSATRVGDDGFCDVHRDFRRA